MRSNTFKCLITKYFSFPLEKLLFLHFIDSNFYFYDLFQIKYTDVLPEATLSDPYVDYMAGAFINERHGHILFAACHTYMNDVALQFERCQLNMNDLARNVLNGATIKHT